MDIECGVHSLVLLLSLWCVWVQIRISLAFGYQIHRTQWTIPSSIVAFVSHLGTHMTVLCCASVYIAFSTLVWRLQECRYSIWTGKGCLKGTWLHQGSVVSWIEKAERYHYFTGPSLVMHTVDSLHYFTSTHIVYVYYNISDSFHSTNALTLLTLLISLCITQLQPE